MDRHRTQATAMSESVSRRHVRRTPSWVLPSSETPLDPSLSTTLRGDAEDVHIARTTNQSPVLIAKRRLFDSVNRASTPPSDDSASHFVHLEGMDDNCEWAMTWKSSLTVFSQLTEHLKECVDKKMLNRNSCAILFGGINQLFGVGCGLIDEQRKRNDVQTKAKQDFKRKISSLEVALEAEKNKRKKVEDKQRQMKCPICFIPYHASEHKQFCVLKCGHIICEDCVTCLCAASAADGCDAFCPSCRTPIPRDETSRQRIFF